MAKKGQWKPRLNERMEGEKGRIGRIRRGRREVEKEIRER